MYDQTMRVEYDALENMRRLSRQAEERRKSMERSLDEAQRRLNSSLAELDRRGAIDSAAMQRELDAEIRKLTEGVDGVRIDLGRALGQQNLKLREQIDILRGDIGSSNKQIAALNQRIDDIAKKFDSDLKAVIERMAGQKDRARVYLNQLDSLLEQANTLHPEKLTPGRVEQLGESRKFILADITNCDFQAAIGLSQTAIPDAVSLIAELKHLNAQFEELSVRAQAACLDVAKRMDGLLDANANQKIIRLGAGDMEREYTYNGDLSFWSDGLFSQLYDSFEEGRAQLQNAFLPQMDLINLEAAADFFSTFHVRIDACEQLAESEFRISCEVQNAALNVYNALTFDDAWALQESGFTDKDVRRSYREVFSDTLGNTAQIVFLPARLAPGANSSPIIFSVDAAGAEHEQSEGKRAILLDALLGRLESTGIDMKACRRAGRKRADESPSEFCKSELSRGTDLKRSRVNRVRRDIIPAENLIGGNENE